MYRITKILNHNAVLAAVSNSEKEATEYLILGKGIGFGKKIAQSIAITEGATVYALQKAADRGDARELVRSIDPDCLEIAGEILDRAQEVFKKVDRNVLIPMADHLAFAVKRIQRNEQIKNPLTQDIMLMFHMEYKVATMVEKMLRERMGLEISEDEIGYIALHIHSATEEANVSRAMKMAQAVRCCVQSVEEALGRPINPMSLSYNRLMNHVKYMIVRIMTGEELKLNMNDYITAKFPETFRMAEEVAAIMEKDLGLKPKDAEIGYLAMHLGRVMADET